MIVFKSILAGLSLLALDVTGAHADEGAAKPAAIQRLNGPGANKTIGFVMDRLDYLFYQTPGGKEECPDGPVVTNRQNWEIQFPTNATRAAHMQRCGSSQNRGPNCENVWFSPESVEDALPFHEVKGKVSYGFNLDGTTDGHETAATCTHEKFVSPDGKPGIDNQWYRFVGCHKGFVDDRTETRVRQDMLNARYRWLIEVTDVDSEINDNHVEVAVYLGRDPLVVDNESKAVPWQSQQATELEFRLHGKITDGVLETEPADVDWDEGIQWEAHSTIHGMKLRMRLTPTGAEVYRTGYVDIDQLWQTYSRTMVGLGNVLAASAPAAYRALHKMADGYKDPKTGQCKGLSSARRFEYVRAFIVHSSREQTAALNK